MYNDIDRDLQAEIVNLSQQISFENNVFRISNLEEWEEREHSSLGINPIFIELVLKDGSSIDKSPNLGAYSLTVNTPSEKQIFYDTTLNGNNIRQVQFPVFHNNNLQGYVLIAMYLQDATTVLFTLAEILFFSYFLILLALYYVTRWIVAKSIYPITAIIDTASVISKDNLNTRIALPARKDELHKLAETINSLLERIERAVEREKQFTADASHELRTPLAVVKGTLEVLIRKPRLQNEYENKINFCIAEVNRMNFLVDELLLLARFENQKSELKRVSSSLNILILEVLSQNATDIKSKKLHISTVLENECYVETDPYLFSIALQNLISNAIKYSHDCGTIEIKLQQLDSQIVLSIKDYGVGIKQEDIDKIFNPFYRSDAAKHPDIKGTGLGLSIVSRLSAILRFTLEITTEKQGTLVTLKLK